MSDNVRVLLVSGSTRNGSANTAALMTAAAALAPDVVNDPRFVTATAEVWHALLTHGAHRQAAIRSAGP